ncbi:hypothetical protein [Hymenobacter norwichensis]|uniref:hypothetical protein n=1 Tax=Hymenobacter norwichensis TaxID=223903 RepID=UPI0003B6ED22|nr:hypothetical protein [Hymenobacter norwichensis]
MLLALGLCIAYCTSNPSATTHVAAQTVGALGRTPPDHPGGKRHTNPGDKAALKNLTKNYADIHFPGTKLPTYEDPKLYYLNREVIDSILKQPGCIGLRIYPAYASKTPPYKPRFIIVGVEKGPGASGKLKDMDGTYVKTNMVQRQCTVVETDDRCPDNCDGTSF